MLRSIYKVINKCFFVELFFSLVEENSYRYIRSRKDTASKVHAT